MSCARGTAGRRSCLITSTGRISSRPWRKHARRPVGKHTYCLMPNHYHLVLETPEPNLVLGMAWLQSTHSIRLNHRHKLGSDGSKRNLFSLSLKIRNRSRGSRGSKVPQAIFTFTRFPWIRVRFNLARMALTCSEATCTNRWRSRISTLPTTDFGKPVSPRMAFETSSAVTPICSPTLICKRVCGTSFFRSGFTAGRCAGGAG